MTHLTQYMTQLEIGMREAEKETAHDRKMRALGVDKAKNIPLPGVKILKKMTTKKKK